jgi:hypothetical protein
VDHCQQKQIDSLKSTQKVFVASYKNLLEKVDTAAAQTRAGGQTMRLTMKQSQAVTAVTFQRYRQGSKKVKRQILDEFCETTGYGRGYARFVLRKHG